MPLVSVITPVFNGESHLHQCIDSVLGQTYQDLEYIIVNNCSQDGTLDIARDYSRRDRRIRIVNNSSFVSCDENHNIGFSQISPHAEYCKVVQADDWIYPECIEKFVKIGEENPTMTLASAYRIDNDHVGLEGLPTTKSFFSGREIARSYLLDEKPCVFGSPTSFFLRAAPVRSHQPFFNTFHWYSDHEACIQVLRDGDFGFVHEILSFTRRAAGRESNKSDRMRANLPAFLCILQNHGRVFLTEEEYTQRIRKHLRLYYLVLARDLLNLRGGRGYLRFHSSYLRNLGHPFNPLRLLAVLPLVPVVKWRNRSVSINSAATKYIRGEPEA